MVKGKNLYPELLLVILILNFYFQLVYKLATSAVASRLHTDMSDVNYLTQSAMTSINKGRCFKTCGQAPWEAAGCESGLLKMGENLLYGETVIKENPKKCVPIQHLVSEDSKRQSCKFPSASNLITIITMISLSLSDMRGEGGNLSNESVL